MSEPSPREDHIVWYRASQDAPWKVVNWASTYKLAVNLIGVGKGNGDWYIAPLSRSPYPDPYKIPDRKNLPCKITCWEQIPLP